MSVPTVRLAGDDDAERWSSFVAAHPESTVYHTLPWRDVVRSAFGHRSRYALAEQDGIVRGVLPMFDVRAPLLGSKLISMPYDLGSGGPLAVDAAAETALMTAAIALATGSGARYLELRCNCRRPTIEGFGLRHDAPALISDLVVDDEAATWDRLHGSQRKAVRAAEKRGVTVREGETIDDLMTFYRIYLRVFHAFGTPPYAPRYVAAVWTHLRPAGMLRVLLADVRGKTVAGMLMFSAGGTLTNKLTMALPEAEPVRAVAALYWRSIQLGLKLGHRVLGLGTSSPAQTGLLTFKERWGATHRPAAVYSLALRGRVPSLDRFYDSEAWPRRLWRRLPLALTPHLGGLINRWFC